MVCRCKLWLKAIGAPRLEEGKKLLICANHFSDVCYLNKNVSNRLTFSAVPDKNLPFIEGECTYNPKVDSTELKKNIHMISILKSKQKISYENEKNDTNKRFPHKVFTLIYLEQMDCSGEAMASKLVEPHPPAYLLLPVMYVCRKRLSVKEIFRPDDV